MSMAFFALSDAISFLTVLPFPCPLIRANPAQRISRALVWFPLVGAGVGGVGALVAFGSTLWWDPSVGALLGLAAMVWLTGGLHLDGLTDTLDGLACHRGPKETLGVMRDSRIGAMAAAGLFFLLGIKWAFLAHLPSYAWFRVLVATGCLSRLGVVFSAQFFPYVPGEKGLGRLATDHKSPSIAALAFVIACLLVGVVLHPLQGAVSLALMFALVWIANRFFLVRLGGITGDTLGAVSELIEVALLAFLSISGSF